MQAPHVMQFSVILRVTANLRGACNRVRPSEPAILIHGLSTEHRKPLEIRLLDA